MEEERLPTLPSHGGPVRGWQDNERNQSRDFREELTRSALHRGGSSSFKHYLRNGVIRQGIIRSAETSAAMARHIN